MANDSEIRSIMTLSSKSEASVTHGLQANYFNTPLHERCTIQDMEKLKMAFKEAYRQKIFFTEFRTLLRDMLNVEYTDEEYKILFLKINTNRNGEICWDELVSHLLLGYFANDPENQRETLEPPIMGLPKVMRSMHRHPISRICFCPDVSKDRSTDPLQGSYITASRDGMVSWWSLNMTRNRYGFSTSPHLKVRTTWVTDMVCMPDVNIIVTSSTERDLRFYDSTAGNFTLKIVITSWEYMICTMYYKFYPDINEKCMLICGDVGGNVRVLQFSPVSRGPFQNQAARALIMLRHIDMVKRPQLLSQLQLIEFPRVHTDWVRQVSFYTSLHCVVSCATCPDSLLMCDVGGSKTHNMFRVEKGVQCFAFEEESHVLVTGGPDCAVRVWNPFVPSKASVTLYGHHAGIIALVLQRGGQTIYSLGRDRVIKVWDVQAQICIQTYVEVPPQVGERTPITAVYNTATREFIMAAIKIAIITLDEQLNPQHTDGSTHSRAVSKILYNPLFKVVITCGMDSIIINWNPVTGKRNVMVRDAHTRMLHGELIPVEITAACFDSAFLLLLTGARNGTLKMWNFNSGVCLRNMSIEHMMEVTSVFWTDGRIFAIGWNKRVIEFDEGGIAPMGKPWETRHNDDVLAAAVRPPLTIATASYTSELIFWKLETGQPYRRFSCTEPMLRIKMSYNKRDLKAPPPISAAATSERSKVSVLRRQSAVTGAGVSLSPVALEKARARRVSTVSMPARAMSMRSLAVHAMMFLETRPHAMHIGSLVLALENGQVQMWSDHPAGGFQGSFQGIHTTGDYVSAFATDTENKYLFSGTTFGYIKVWLMTNYATTDKVHINMPELRVQFPFMWRDRIEGRAKRSVRDQPLPVLCNSYRGHMRCITTMGYINDQKIVLSGSSDYSVRLWRLSGEYLQTLGSFVPWTLQQTRFPPDVRKVASFTTFKVWRGGEVSRYVPGQVEVDKLRDITESELTNKTYGAPCEEPLLGHYLELPRRADRQEPIVLDDSLPTIPLYTHLRMASTQPVRRPATPELVCQTRLKKGVVRKTHFTPGSAPSQMAAPAAAEPSSTAAAAAAPAAGAAPAPAAGGSAPALAAAPAAELDGQPQK